MKQLPNIISCLRIVMSVMLLYFTDNPIPFVVVYCLCGVSDAADGYLARRLHAETPVGAKLDTAGDAVFFAVWLFVLGRVLHGENGARILRIVLLAASIRVTNLVITKAKFQQWGIMHTVGNKLTGLALFLVLPVLVLAESISLWSIYATGAVAVLSALEESLILLKSKRYDANTRSVCGKAGRC